MFNTKEDQSCTSWENGANSQDNVSGDLLRAIVRCADRETLHRLAANLHDWELLLKLAQGNRIIPILFSRLSDMGPMAPPAAVLERIQAEYERNILHCTTNAAELITLLKTFAAKGIQAMPFKGIVLAASAYHDYTLRTAGDLDLLIHHDDLARSAAILRERGFEPATPLPENGAPVPKNMYECSFERREDGMLVDLSWRFALGRAFKRFLGMDWVWPKRRVAMLAGTEIPDMSQEHTLLVLCMHGCKHSWHRFIWICDVAQLLRSSPALDWTETTAEARNTGLWRCLALGVMLSHRIANAPVPQDVLAGFESDRIARKLAEHFDKNLFIAPGSIPASIVPYTIRLLGWRDRARLLFPMR